MTEMQIAISGYNTIFEEAADGSWSATVPSLPGIATCGETLDEAKVMAAEAIQVWIEIAVEKGEEIPAPAH